jgi:fused signal recognition particle receptor
MNKTQVGLLAKFAGRLKRSSTVLTEKVFALMGGRKLDQATLEALQNLLIESDLGIEAAQHVTNRLGTMRLDGILSSAEIKTLLIRELTEILEPVEHPFSVDNNKKPFVVLMVGVNGSGKTTTLGKLSAYLREEGFSVMMAAGDTFRAAAVEQLMIWGQRTGVEVVSGKQGGDPAGLVFEAMKRAHAEEKDVLLVDTAGRLQNKAGLMAELEKIIRVMRKRDDSAPHAVFLTLDATVGQDALKQVELFSKTAGVTGLIMTKLDGTARGGILVALATRFGLPIHFVGLGEGEEDLYPFSASAFAQALVGTPDSPCE